MNKFTTFIIGAVVAVAVLVGIFYLLDLSGGEREVDNPETVETSEMIETDRTVLSEDLDGEYVLDPEQSELNWEGRKVILKDWIDRGTIDVESGELIVEAGQISEGSFVIDMSSIAAASTGSGGGQDRLTGHLMSADFFDVENYPTATFELKSVSSTSDTTLVVMPSVNNQVTGDLTIKGVTNEISFPAEIFESEGNLVAKATVELDRTDWDIRFGSGKFFDNLGDNVIDDMFTLEFTLVATKK